MRNGMREEIDLDLPDLYDPNGEDSDSDDECNLEEEDENYDDLPDLHNRGEYDYDIKNNMEDNNMSNGVCHDEDSVISEDDSFYEADNLVENGNYFMNDVDMELVDNQLECSPWNQLPPNFGLECINNFKSSSNNVTAMEVDVHWDRVDIMRDKNNYLNLHALFNKQMSLLIRTKSILKPTKKEQSFLQRITSSAGCKSVPLLYPEGMLFPSLFWKGKADGSIDGAIPSGFWTDNKFCGKYGYAGIEDHMRTRLMNSSLPMSCNPDYIFFAFDAVNNLLSRGIDNRYVLKRGFEHMLGDSSIHRVNNDEIIGCDVIDSRKTVAQLSSMIREEEPTYFYTHTCNQKSHFGVFPIRKWIDEKCRDIAYDVDLGPSAKECKIRSLHEVGTTILTRAWMRAGKYFMDYITRSKEEPLGPVKTFWWRWEYQEANGNVPHIHALVWTGEEKSGNSLMKIQERIGCSTLDILQ